VARVTLNRPDVRNAMDETVIAGLTATFEKLSASDDVRCIVLTGEGKAFCAGGDLNWMRRTADYGHDENYADAQKLGESLKAINNARQPVIGLINGAAFGGGVGVTACCDIVIACDTAKFSLSEVRLGLLPATISPYVARKIGERNARRYFLTAEIFDAATARELGLVHEVVAADALEAEGERFIEFILLGAPGAQAASKDLIFKVVDRPVDTKLIDWTATRIADLRASDEGKEGASSFLEKRKPNWQERDV
jgi:methylglutaconyl-CoA hydratase